MSTDDSPGPPNPYTPPPLGAVPQQAPPPAKKSALPWVLGGCGCLLLLSAIIAIAAVVFFGVSVKKEMEKIVPYDASTTTGTDDDPLPSSGSGGSFPADWLAYVNEPSIIPAGLQEHFVDFSFRYPPKFKVVPGNANFIKIEESAEGTDGTSFTLENFAVGYISATPEILPGSDQELIFPMLAEQLGTQFAQSFPNFRNVGQEPMEVAGHKGLAYLFEAELTDAPNGSTKIYGKVLLARQPGMEKGVAIVMLATDLDAEVESAEDVGVKGDLGPILDSFRLGR